MRAAIAIFVVLFASAFAAGDFFGGEAGSGGSASLSGALNTPVSFSTILPANGGWSAIGTTQFKTSGAGKVNYYVRASVSVSGCPGGLPAPIGGVRLVRIDGATTTQVWAEGRNSGSWSATTLIGGGTSIDIANINSIYQVQAYSTNLACVVNLAGVYFEVDEPISL